LIVEAEPILKEQKKKKAAERSRRILFSSYHFLIKVLLDPEPFFV